MEIKGVGSNNKGGVECVSSLIRCNGSVIGGNMEYGRRLASLALATAFGGNPPPYPPSAGEITKASFHNSKRGQAFTPKGLSA